MALSKEMLDERISKLNIQIEKIRAKIAKWENKKNMDSFIKDRSWLYNNAKTWEEAEVYVVYHNKKDLRLSYEEYLEDCDLEIRHAQQELENALNTLEKYNVSLTALDNFSKEEKIKVIWEFLLDWKKKTYEWYLANCKLYFKLKEDEKESWESYCHDNALSIDKYSRISLYRLENNWKIEYYSAISPLTNVIANYYDRTIDTAKLENELTGELHRKYKDLVARVTAVVGNIADASNLSIGNQNGEINGYVIGDKGKAEVNTISAGGYNIQCFHYRVLVKRIK